MGPLLLAALPLLILTRRRLERFLALAALFFLTWVSGVIGSSSLWQSRLLLPALLLIIPALSGAITDLRRFDHPELSLLRLMTMVIALVMAVTLLTQAIGLLEMNPVAYLLGAESREHYLLRQTGAHAEAMTAVAALPDSARVQFMWEPRSYLAGRTVRADPLLDALPHLIATHGGLAAVARDLKATGFTHVLVYETGAAFAIEHTPDLYSQRDAEALQQFEAEYGRIIFDNKVYRLLELK
jgi:hypothetical protein